MIASDWRLDWVSARCYSQGLPTKAAKVWVYRNPAGEPAKSESVYLASFLLSWVLIFGTRGPYRTPRRDVIQQFDILGMRSVGRVDNSVHHRSEAPYPRL